MASSQKPGRVLRRSRLADVAQGKHVLPNLTPRVFSFQMNLFFSLPKRAEFSSPGRGAVLLPYPSLQGPATSSDLAGALTAPWFAGCFSPWQGSSQASSCSRLYLLTNCRSYF